ncbi:MAG: response regulator [Acidobacteria bacterium]|nr:response regulator [Acidobacteriota bacterium]
MKFAESSHDPVLLVGAKGRVISANLAFHTWLKAIAPHNAAHDSSTWFTDTPAYRALDRRAFRTERKRPMRIQLRSALGGASLSCLGIVDGSPFEETYLIRISAPSAGKGGAAPLGPNRPGARRSGAVLDGVRPAGRRELRAIAAAAQSLASSRLEEWQLAQVDSIRRNAEALLQGTQQRETARRGLEPRKFSMRDNRELRVLLVEDNPINRTVASHMLARLGFSPDVCTNGNEAVERATAQAYDLILMDVQMPEMDGIEATYRIRELRISNRPTRIVALTANTVDDTRLACERAGMDGFLAKPFTLAELSTTLKRLLDSPLDGTDL